MDTLLSSVGVLGILLGLLSAAFFAVVLFVLGEAQPYEASSKILLMVFTRNTKNCIGPRDYQDWYRQVVHTIRRLRSYKRQRTQVSILLVGRSTDIAMYTKTFVETFALHTGHLSGIETVSFKQQKAVIAHMREKCAEEIEVISTISQFPLIHWLTEELRPHYILCLGIPGPGHLIRDIFTSLYPLPDLVWEHTIRLVKGPTTIVGVTNTPEKT